MTPKLDLVGMRFGRLVRAPRKCNGPHDADDTFHYVDGTLADDTPAARRPVLDGGLPVYPDVDGDDGEQT